MRALHTLYGVYALTIFGIVIFGLSAPLILLGPTLSIRRACGRAGVHLAFLLIGAPIRVRGTENLPVGTCIAVANHASYLDGIILTAALPGRYTFVVQDGAAGWPVVGLIIRRMGVSFINRSSPREGSRQTRALMRRLHDGESLAVFPEGTFKRGPGLLNLRDGAFLMAARTRTPVAPCVIRGTRKMPGDGQYLPRWSSLHIDVLPPVQSEDTHREAARALRDQVRRRILQRCGEPDRTQATTTPAGDAGPPTQPTESSSPATDHALR